MLEDEDEDGLVSDLILLRYHIVKKLQSISLGQKYTDDIAILQLSWETYQECTMYQ